MTKEDFKERTLVFGCSTIEFVRSLPLDVANDVIGKHLIRSATSVGANYRAVCRARSRAESVAKFGIVEEEADECMFWLEVLRRCGHGSPAADALYGEANELLSMTVASIRTMRAKDKASSEQNPLATKAVPPAKSR